MNLPCELHRQGSTMTHSAHSCSTWFLSLCFQYPISLQSLLYHTAAPCSGDGQGSVFPREAFCLPAMALRSLFSESPYITWKRLINSRAQFSPQREQEFILSSSMNDHGPGKRCSTAEVVTLDFIHYRTKNIISHDIYHIQQWGPLVGGL